MPPFTSTISSARDECPSNAMAWQTAEQSQNTEIHNVLLWMDQCDFQGPDDSDGAFRSSSEPTARSSSIPSSLPDIVDFGIVDSLTLCSCKHIISDIFDGKDDLPERGNSRRGHRRSGQRRDSHQIATFTVRTKTG
ncbi:hypothetical protein HJC23_013695 [Cyclotella cryptica]|uniref:Uncharacterized protein n=1 Tax=Cyclotella cryptica TaxID=29204 RepID=A0ABD3QYJ7_9STRA